MSTSMKLNTPKLALTAGKAAASVAGSAVASSAGKAAAKAASPKLATKKASPPASTDSVKLGSETTEPKSDGQETVLADSLMMAYADSASEAPTETKADTKPGGDAKAKTEPRPFFASPGQLYSEKHTGKGDDVKEFQQMLGMDQTGEFDQETTDAVKAFQKKNGLKEDGILGPDTIGRLNESQKAEGAESPKPAGGAYKTKKDGSIYHALMEKGFSETEIANGKLVEETRRLNPDLKSSHLKAGTDLQVPIRRERQPSAEGEHSVGMQSDKLKSGQAQSSKAANNDLGIDHSSQLSKSEEGAPSLRTDVTNKKNSDVNLTTTTQVGKGGHINTASTATNKGVRTETVAENADGSAGIKATTNSTPNGTTQDLEGLGKPNDSSLTSDGKTAQFRDPGSKEAGDAINDTDITEASDGPVESFLSNVAEFLGHREEAPSTVKIDGIQNARLYNDSEGRVRAKASAEGTEVDVPLAPGDSDDSVLERGGEVVDQAWDAGKTKLISLLDSFFGVKKPSKEAQKSTAQ